MRSRAGRLLGIVVLGGMAVGAAGCLPVVPQPPTPPPTLFPSDSLTVSDPAQATGKRMNLPLPDCIARPSDCAEINLVNQLDGFDVDPTIEIGFAGAIDVAKVTDASVYVQSTGGSPIGLNRLVWDPTTKTLYGHPKHQLAEATQHQLVVTDAVNGQAGTSTFTTMSATVGLRKMREQLDSGQAYTDAGLPDDADRLLRIDNDSASEPAAYSAVTIAPVAAFNRTNDLGSSMAPEQAFDSTATATVNTGTYAFGSFDAPQWLDETERTIPTLPTGGPAPAAVRAETIGFVARTPGASCTEPPGGWPVAIFGPGVTRSKYDVLLASDENLRNCMATIAIDPVGHAYGRKSTVTITKVLPPGTVTVTSHGRGRDIDGDLAIGSREGVQTKGQPDDNASIGLRDGLRQTALDNMSLVRALQADYDPDPGGESGFAIPGGGTLSRSSIKFYAQSLGGIYGTMVMATDPQLTVGALNVAGGPILEIARLSPGFRGEVGAELENREPELFDCTPSPPSSPDCTDFDEQTPLYLDPPVTNPSASSIAIQKVGARTNWIDRAGSPEAFAPFLRPGTPGKRVLYQFAYGDRTVPNPASATVMRAGDLQPVTSLYRNDQDVSATPGCDPHGFLLDPRISVLARRQAQEQIAMFFISDGSTIQNPGPPWEVPIANPSSIETTNFSTIPPPPSCAAAP